MPQKPLKDLDGTLVWLQGRPERDCLFFECPVCTSGHGIMVSWNEPPIAETSCVWTKTGLATLDDISLSPSIDCTKPILVDGQVHPSDCGFHGWVTKGQVVW